MLKVVSKSDKLYELTDSAGTFLGSLTYENWMNSKAAITTQYGEFYDLTTKGFWKSHVEVEIGGDIFATLRHNWRGNVIVDLSGNDIERDYLIAEKGFWKNHYVLLDSTEQEVMKLLPTSQWFNKYSYDIEINAGFEKIVNETLILISAFCANAIRQRKRAASAAS